jgi:hypothetical protein
MSLSRIASHIEEIEKDAALFEKRSFDRRAEALDFLGFHVLDHAEAPAESRELNLLKQRAEKLKAKLELVDDGLFQKLCANIRAGNCRGNAFKELVYKYFDLDVATTGEPGYDNLDLFINRLISFDTLPEPTKALEPEMVYYQKTPARIVFELAAKWHFTKNDVFFDLGSGLGQTTILIHLLTGVKATGIEFEPAFCDYAQNRALELNLPAVTFINADVRKADCSPGTVFFLYTPFTGEMLHEVLKLLRKESTNRKIRIITYGPCTPQVARETWLRSDGPMSTNIYVPAFFCSI